MKAIKLEKSRIREKTGRRQKAALCFLLPSFLGLSIFIFIPFLDVIRRSFLDAMGRNFVGLGNYKTIFQNEAFFLAALNTVKFVILCIPLLLIVSLLLALLIQNAPKFSNAFKTIFMLPMAIPAASIVMVFKMLFHKSGIINGLFGMGIDWLYSQNAFYILIGSYIWKNMGYDMVLLIAGLSAIPKELYEAASVDGAGAWQSFLKITLPNLMPTIFTVTVLSLINSFKVFREAYLLSGSYPHESIYMLQHLFNNWFVALDIQKLCAAAVIVAIIALLAIILLRRLWDGDK